jgi:DNA-binding CsgD family transcriptional regulator
VDLARETYLDAWGAAWFAGSLATAGGLREVSRAARLAPPSTHPSQPFDLLLDGLALLITEGRAAAALALRRASSAFLAAETPAENSFRWTALPPIPSYVLWDDESWYAINARQLGLAREAGALARVPMGLITGAVIDAWSGEFAKATEATAEADAIVEATGTRLAPYAAMLLVALQGREADGFTLESAITEAAAVGQGFAVQWGEFVKAILFNGLGRYGEALVAAQRASDDTPELFISSWALAELIEAASRSVAPGHAASALERLTDDTAVAGTDWGLGIAARSRALLTDGDAAESLYREAIERLGRTRLRSELARAHLLYGEWLRLRRERRLDARNELRIAHEMFVSMGTEGFAARAKRELLATGERVRTRSVETRDELTPQEAQIARLARDGLSNSEIGARLFVSQHTVAYHLRKVFSKLDITSRSQLRRALPDRADAGRVA